ncbi:MAG: peptidoglycan-N-acetylglucosamine deacetylase [Solirubrobacteraceae bacterium]|jgi:peptidoglycan/xylan/chitin deacetylase (PgdA/CDA1 family)|nr:peptidoglycan-N-acetylglucosamine deacetylase [Solirubrobacteraceae bacterium]
MEARSSDERRARRVARDHAQRRGRLAALGALALIVAIVALSLNQAAPAGGPSPPRPSTQQGPPGASSQAAADDKAIDDVLEYTPYVARGTRRRKELALTFDDGPGSSTPALLRYLTTHDVPATFFLVGRAIGEHPDVVRRESRAGFSLGTHTENHARLGSRTRADQSLEILTAADRITQISGHAVRLFRPPYGSFDATTLAVLHAERMLMALWTVDTRDYAAPGPRPIVRAALDGARAGAVVLMHDGPGPRPSTLAALRTIVPALRRRGYRLVSLPTLLRDDPPPRHQRAPHSLAG